MIKKLLPILLCILLVITAAACKKEPDPTPAPTPDNGSTEGGGGTQGEETTLRYSYTLTSKEGTPITVEVHKGRILYVKGTGAMPENIDEAYEQPWYEHGGENATERSDAEGGTMTVTAIVVEEGITELSDNAFQDFKNLETVSLPASLRMIGAQAFAKCPKLHTVTGGNGVTLVEAGAFRYCNQLAGISLSATLELVEESAFDNIILPGITRSLAVTFYGDEAAWQALIGGKLQSGNAALEAATVTYKS